MAKTPYQKIVQKGTKQTTYTKVIRKTQSNNPYLKFIKDSQNNTPFQDFINKTQKTNTYNERVKQAQSWYTKKKKKSGKGQKTNTEDAPEQKTKTSEDSNDPNKDGVQQSEQPEKQTTEQQTTKAPADDNFRRGQEREMGDGNKTETSVEKEPGTDNTTQSKESENPTEDIIPPQYPKPGWMFSFSYDPKHAETLEYYDISPMILVISATPTGFMGVNFHYLSPMDRAKFLDALQKYATWDDETNALSINISYSILMAKTELAYYKPCFKMYLSSHVVGDVSPILPTEWDIAMFVPSEQFKKATREQVWADSKFKMGEF